MKLSIFFWWNEAIEVIKATAVVEAVEVIEATEVFRTTQILKINNIMVRITLFRYFEKNFFSNRLLEFYWNIELSQNWGCGGQGCHFEPNQRVISQMPLTQDSQTTFKPNLTYIFLSTRAKWSIKVCVGTPCSWQSKQLPKIC